MKVYVYTPNLDNTVKHLMANNEGKFSSEEPFDQAKSRLILFTQKKLIAVLNEANNSTVVINGATIWNCYRGVNLLFTNISQSVHNLDNILSFQQLPNIEIEVTYNVVL